MPALFIAAPKWKYSTYPSTDEQRKCGTCISTEETIIQQKEY
jgi:hypothetical protein